MSSTRKIISGFLVILIFTFLINFPATGNAVDSLKIAVVLEAPNQVELDSLSGQLIQTFDLYSQLNAVRIDTNLSISIEPFAIDSIALAILKQQQFQGLVLVSISKADSIETLLIKAMKIDGLTPKIITEMDFTSDSLSNKINLIVEKIADYFQSLKTTPADFRVLIVPMGLPNQDSLFLSYRQALIDTFRAAFTSPLFSNIHLQILPQDSTDGWNHSSDWNESTLLKIQQTYQADMVIWGKIDRNGQQDIIYYPYLMLSKQSNPGHSDHADIKSLTGKTCQPKQFSFAPVTINKVTHITTFLLGYFLVQSKRYTEAIKILKSVNSMPADFYLAESYLNRGVSRGQNFVQAQADWDSSVFYLKKCIIEAESPYDSICVNNNLGVAFQMLGKPDSAIFYFSQANTSATNLTDHHYFVQTSNNLGNVYLLNGQWKQALDVFQSSVEAVEQSKDSLNLAATYENLGNIYQLILQRNKAITHYNNALAIRKSIKDEAGIAKSLHFLGDVHQEKNELETAKEYFKQSLSINQKLCNEPRIADSYDRLGQVFQGLGSLDSALIYYQNSIETFEMLDDSNGLVRTILHQASVFQKQKNFKKALSLFEQALQFADSSKSILLQAQILDRMGDTYNNQDSLISAVEYYQQAADLYEQLNNYQNLSLILYNMGLIRLKQDRYAEGYQLLKRAVALDEEYGFHNLSGEKDFLDQLEGILGKN